MRLYDLGIIVLASRGLTNTIFTYRKTSSWEIGFVVESPWINDDGDDNVDILYCHLLVGKNQYYNRRIWKELYGQLWKQKKQKIMKLLWNYIPYIYKIERFKII